MKDIIDFLGKSPAFFVATVDADNKPKVRPFSFVMEWNGKLTFVLSTAKKVYQQLKLNPNVEICSYSPDDAKWIRIEGEIKFTADIEAKRKVFEVMPSLKDIYLSEENPELVCFYIEKGTVSTYSFTSTEVEVTNI